MIPLEKDVRGGVLSGAGGSWVYNLLLAEAPVRLKAVASLLLGLNPEDELDRFDTPITLFQTAFEEVEMANWGVPKLTVCWRMVMRKTCCCSEGSRIPAKPRAPKGAKKGESRA